MAKVRWKGGTLEAPIPPALVTCGSMETSNIITVAWTGIISSDPPRTYISVRGSRFSHEIIRSSGEFAVNMTTASLVRAADWCGNHTGRKTDKFAHCRLGKQAASEIACPIIEESPLVLECRVEQILPMDSHDMFIARIVAVDVDEALLTPEGRLSIGRAHLAAFAHGEYYELGRRIGKIGYSVKKRNRPFAGTAEGDK